MNFNFFLFIGFISVLFISCNPGNDELGPAIPKENVVNYFPLSKNNSWKYEYEEEILNHYIKNNIQTITITDSIKEYDTPSFLFSSDIKPEDQGVITSLLTGGTINKVESKLVFNGDFVFRFPVLGDSIIIPLENALILHQNRKSGDLLSSFSDQNHLKIELENNEIPVEIEYDLKFFQSDSFKNSQEIFADFEDVISSRLVLSLSGKSFTNDTSIEVIPTQEVLTTSIYFAKDIGIFYVHSEYNLQIKNLEIWDLPDSYYKGIGQQQLKALDVHLKK